MRAVWAGMMKGTTANVSMKRRSIADVRMERIVRLAIRSLHPFVVAIRSPHGVSNRYT